jgi:hypothetical protein
MLALRKDDGATRDALYTPGTGFGMTPAFLSGE